MKLAMKRFGLLAIAFAVMIAFTPMFSDGIANAKSKIKLSAKTVSMAKGTTYTLKVKGVKAKKVKKIKWKSSNKKIVKVTKKGKLKAKLTAKKPGKVTITAKVKLKNKKKYKKLKCKVTVYKKKTLSNAGYLRNYILENGKKTADPNVRYIDKVITGEQEEEVTDLSIAANKKNNELKFERSYKCDTPDAAESCVMTVNLISGKDGKVKTRHDEDYNRENYDECTMTIKPAAYTKSGKGLTFTDVFCYRVDEREDNPITEDEKTAAKEDAKNVLARSFDGWNTFLKAKKIKNNKTQLTMKNIGFSNY